MATSASFPLRPEVFDVARSADGVFLFVGAAGEGHVAAARDGYFEFFYVEGAFEIARATAVELKRIAFDGGSDFDVRGAAVADLADAAKGDREFCLKIRVRPFFHADLEGIAIHLCF